MSKNRRINVFGFLVFLITVVYISTCLIKILTEREMISALEKYTRRKLPSTYFNTTIEGPGVILRVKGGIGNQLFQYACSYALARRKNYPLFNYILREDNNSTKIFSAERYFLPHQREFALDKFQIPLDNFIDSSTVINGSVSYITDSQLLYGNYTENPFLELGGGSYCQSENYWDEYKFEIAAMFRLSPEVAKTFPPYVTMLEKEIEMSEESVAVHIRRGDFTAVPGYEVPISYQNSAIQRLIKILNEQNSSTKNVTLKFFIFSDDIDYAKQQFKEFSSIYDFRFVSSPDESANRTTSIQDFYLMTKCKHFIIPNSTFAWWAAYLSMRWGRSACTTRIFIASACNPKFWDLFKDEQENQFYKFLYRQMYYPKEWIIIDPFVTEK